MPGLGNCKNNLPDSGRIYQINTVSLDKPDYRHSIYPPYPGKELYPLTPIDQLHESSVSTMPIRTHASIRTLVGELEESLHGAQHIFSSGVVIASKLASLQKGGPATRPS